MADRHQRTHETKADPYEILGSTVADHAINVIETLVRFIEQGQTSASNKIAIVGEAKDLLEVMKNKRPVQ